MNATVPILSIETALAALHEGEVIAWPTEAVWGLGCDPLNQAAVMKLLQIKQRLVEQGLILVAADFEQFQQLVAPVSVCELSRALASWPGPVTWLFPCRASTPAWLTGKHQTLAVRVSDHPLTRRLCRLFNGPLVSTSANPGGQAPALTTQQLQKYFTNTELAGYLPGELGGRDQVSTIRDLASDTIIR